MPFNHTYQTLCRFLVGSLFCLGAILGGIQALAQVETKYQNIDPRLVEVIKIIKARSNQELKASQSSPTRDEIYLSFFEEMETAFYSRKPEEITKAAEDFKRAYKGDSNIELARVYMLHMSYARLSAADATHAEIQSSISNFIEKGSWLERYMAFSLSAHLHATAQERQAALQKAQQAFSLIPTDLNHENQAYISYAKIRIASLIAHLHNLQGNSELALTTSLDYLRLTNDNPDLNVEIDLLNNLIYSYSIGRNHEAQLYLSEQLLEIEKTHSSSVKGLSEMRISGVMNASGRFSDGLTYAQQSMRVATNPIIQRAAQVNNAIALAGLGRLEESRTVAKLADVNFSSKHMLEVETRRRDLYLAFLLAQAEDPQYATQLFNRQLDVKAQEFLANNSRDTTAMLAALENSRERQAEREAASAREANLQALTISRQKKLNRVLMVLSALLGLAVVAGLLFTRYRERILRKLEIKTKEAASAEKLKTEFLGMISHELRTPLNGIIGISDYLANYHEDEDIRHKTGIVLNSGNELLSVVESLTDMARIDAGQLELVPHDADLNLSLAAVPENWTEKASEKGLTFTYFIDPAIGRYHVDEDRIIQCVNILLSNAVSFTDAGRVHLHVTLSKTAPLELTVVVADTGQGMSELVQSRLFTPFMQADTSRKRTHMGTGLNLAIAYALAKMMDGELNCVSRSGRGSEFTFNIPLRGAISEPQAQAIFNKHDDIERLETAASETEVTENKPAESLPQTDFAQVALDNLVPDEPALNRPDLEPPILDQVKSGSGEFVDLMAPSKSRPSLHSPRERGALLPHKREQRVLVVDDMDSNRDVLSLMLEAKGYICREAADGLAALRSLERQTFDYMILDIHMTPLDGIETLRRIRASAKPYANIPVIALTADNAPRTNAEAMEAGADLFLAKPIKQDELMHAISYLRNSASSRILSQQA